VVTHQDTKELKIITNENSGASSPQDNMKRAFENNINK
jgi:hypothetical protein